jgi:hypothetical protein
MKINIEKPEDSEWDYDWADRCAGACRIMGWLSLVGTLFTFFWMIDQHGSMESVAVVFSCLVGALLWWGLSTLLKVALNISRDLAEIAFASKLSAYWIDRANAANAVEDVPASKPAAEPADLADVERPFSPSEPAPG